MPKRRLLRWSELSALLTFKEVTWSATQRRLEAAHTVDDLRVIAKRRTPRAIFDYTDGGAGDELSMQRNRDAYSRVEFDARVLRDVAKVDTTIDILGTQAAMPVILAPTGFTRMMHHTGEIAVARSAARAGIPYSLSTMGTTTPEELAAAVPDVRRWFQLYMWRDRGASRDLVQRASAQGYDTLVLTVDTPVGGARLRDRRNGMTIPPSLTLRTLVDGARHPHWWINFLTTEPLEFASLNNFSGTVADLVDLVFDPTATLPDLEWLRSEWNGRLVVKGIQSAADAKMVVDAGADAVVISNHGGRQLDRASTPLEQLPNVRDIVSDAASVYVDGGIRSGADVAAAVGLGADAVMIGRPYLYGLMAGGEQGVDRTLQLIQSELENAMRLIGVTHVEDLVGRAHMRRGF